MKFRIVYLFVGLLLGYLLAEELLPSLGFNRPVVRTDTVTNVEYRDSLVYRDTTIFETDTLWFPKYITKAAPVKPNEDSTLVYNKSISLDTGLIVNYTANVTGRLNWINFGYIDARPERWRVKEVTTTITNTIEPAGLYIGGSAWNDGLGLNITYVKSRWLYQYNFKSGSHGIVVGYKMR